MREVNTETQPSVTEPAKGGNELDNKVGGKKRKSSQDGKEIKDMVDKPPKEANGNAKCNDDQVASRTIVAATEKDEDATSVSTGMSTAKSTPAKYNFRGVNYSTYQEMVSAKRDWNENYLKSLGLRNRMSSQKTPEKKTNNSGSDYHPSDDDETEDDDMLDNYASKSRTARNLKQKEEMRSNKRAKTAAILHQDCDDGDNTLDMSTPEGKELKNTR